MPNTLVITKVGPEADRILDAFQERTKLAARDGETARIFTFEGAGHDVDVGAELDAVAEARRGRHADLIWTFAYEVAQFGHGQSRRGALHYPA
jgi:hypothetical protein